MGTEAVWVPLVIAAVGTAAQVYTTERAADKRDDTLASQLRAQAEKQRDADAKTSQLIQSQSNIDASEQRGESMATFRDQLQQHQSQAKHPIQTQGAVSDAYQQAGSNAALGITKAGSKFADLVSRIDAPAQQRMDNMKTLHDYSSDINLIKRANRGDDFLSRMRLRSIRPDPWINAAGDVAQGYAANYDYGDGGGAANGSAYFDTMPTNANYDYGFDPNSIGGYMNKRGVRYS